MFKALKPCTVAGIKYIIDDEVDTSKLSDAEIEFLIKRKFIIKAGEGETIAPPPAVPELLTVPVSTDDGTLEISLSVEQLLNVVAILQLNAENAIKAIKGITEEAPLILIHRLDNRKSVQEAAQKRAEALAKAAEEASKDASTGNGENENGDGNPASGENENPDSTGNGDDE